MELIETSHPDVKLVKPKIFRDDRGFFYESFQQEKWQQLLGPDAPLFVQDNHSKSSRGVLRGLHLQIGDHPQGKLVRVISGEIYDVAVDIRPGPRFGQWVAQYLNAEDAIQMWVPAGFAHGFVVLSETTEICYKATDYYYPALDKTLRWDDPSLAIPWPLNGAEPILSNKDRVGLTLQQIGELAANSVTVGV